MHSSIINSKASNLVFLHGWGGCWQSWYPILERLKKGFNLFAPDLPGFGQETITKALNLSDYSTFIKKYLETNRIQNPILIGHSFGGAIICDLLIRYPKLSTKIVLVDAAPIRHLYTKSQKIKFKIIGFLKKIFPFTKNFYYKLTNQDKSDYATITNPILQQTFKNVIQADLSPFLNQIKAETLIIWGENDTSTPIADGQKIHQLIQKSKIKIYSNTSHFSYLEKQDEFTKDIIKFVKL